MTEMPIPWFTRSPNPNGEVRVVAPQRDGLMLDGGWLWPRGDDFAQTAKSYAARQFDWWTMSNGNTLSILDVNVTDTSGIIHRFKVTARVEFTVEKI